MKIIIILISVSIFLSAAPLGHCFLIKGPEKTLEAPAYRIRGTDYLPLTVICDAYGIDWKWDPALMTVDLNRGSAAVRLRVGEYKVYANGAINVQERPVVLHKGAVCIPSDFLRTIFNKLFLAYPAKAVAQAPAEEITPQRAAVSYYKINKIVLDAGHGGYDPGAIGRDGIKEKYIALDITKRIKELLENEGIEVVETRKEDRFIPLWSRVEIANRSNADLFISIHANASRTKRLKGFEVYFLSEAADDDVYKNADVLDAILLDLVCTENRRDAVRLGNSILDNIDVSKRALKSAKFFVLKGARMPAILIEVGYISNTDECLKLGWKDYRNKIAGKIVKGILKYGQTHRDF